MHWKRKVHEHIGYFARMSCFEFIANIVTRFAECLTKRAFIVDELGNDDLRARGADSSADMFEGSIFFGLFWSLRSRGRFFFFCKFTLGCKARDGHGAQYKNRCRGILEFLPHGKPPVLWRRSRNQWTPDVSLSTVAKSFSSAMSIPYHSTVNFLSLRRYRVQLSSISESSRADSARTSNSDSFA